jgi:hypothetical protein
VVGGWRERARARKREFIRNNTPRTGGGLSYCVYCINPKPETLNRVKYGIVCMKCCIVCMQYGIVCMKYGIVCVACIVSVARNSSLGFRTLVLRV